MVDGVLTGILLIAEILTGTFYLLMVAIGLLPAELQRMRVQDWRRRSSLPHLWQRPQ
jgi:membrane protein implicated in regulation of membrane protease activity